MMHGVFEKHFSQRKMKPSYNN